MKKFAPMFVLCGILAVGCQQQSQPAQTGTESGNKSTAAASEKMSTDKPAAEHNGEGSTIHTTAKPASDSTTHTTAKPVVTLPETKPAATTTPAATAPTTTAPATTKPADAKPGEAK